MENLWVQSVKLIGWLQYKVKRTMMNWSRNFLWFSRCNFFFFFWNSVTILTNFKPRKLGYVPRKFTLNNFRKVIIKKERDRRKKQALSNSPTQKYKPKNVILTFEPAEIKTEQGVRRRQPYQIKTSIGFFYYEVQVV